MSTETCVKPLPRVTSPSGRPEDELRPPPLRTNFAWTMAGNGTYFLCQWVWTMVLAKLSGPAMVGRFAIGLAVCAPVVMFTRLQLRDIQATDARNEYRFGDYLGLRLISVCAGSAVIVAIALASSYSRADVLTIMAIVAFRAVESVSDIIYGFLQKWERFELVSRSLMIKGPASIAALGGVVYFTGSLPLGAVGIAAAWLCLLLFYDAPNARRLMRARGLTESLRPASLWSRTRMRMAGRLVWLALPLGVVALLDSLNQNVPRYVIQHYLGSEQLGFYAVMAYVIVAGNMVVSALANSAQPRLSRRYLNNIGAFKHLVWKLVQFGVALGVAVVLGVALLGRPFLAVFYTPEFARNADAFVWIMVAAGIGFVARFLVYAMTAARYLRAQTPLYAGVLVVVSLASWWLVPAHGLLGAAWATCAGMLVLVIGASAVIFHAVRAREAALLLAEPLPGPSADVL